MDEPRLSDNTSSFREETPHMQLTGNLSETPRANQDSVNSMGHGVDSQNESTSTSVHRSISRSDGEVSFIKLEAPATLTKPPPDACGGFDPNHMSQQGGGVAAEEPLQIQCGENAALLYVSKLCQGSKGPCILFQNEWLTPNELQYISGRETAKDWKRSIRYKGKSLKSLIARGLIRVHPPICDCLGCRISSPVNRGRLADKCGLSPTSLRKRKEDSRSSVSSWHDEHLHGSRHFSSSDIKRSLDRRPLAASNGIDQRDTNSSSSECSEISADESAFYSAGGKRPRSLTPPTMDRAGGKKRRSSDSASLCYPGQEQFHFERNGRAYADIDSVDQSIQNDLGTRGSQNGDECDQATNMHVKNNSAFRTVLKDGSLTMTATHPEAAGDSLTCSQAEALQREVLARTLKARGLNPGHTFFPSQFSPCLSSAALIRPGQTSPRLLADPYVLASHASKMYQRAGLQSLQQSYMHYGLMAPMHQNLTQTFQASNVLSDSEARASVDSSPPRQTSSRCGSPTSKESSKDKETGRGESRNKVEGSLSEKTYSEVRVRAEESDQESTTHKSQASSPSLSDNPNFKSPLHKRVPRLHVDLSDNVLSWNTDDVCHFVLSITRSVEISQAFREENIDGHSLVLIREEHLLDRMSVKLGPALKILAQINKLVENMENDKESNPS